MVASFDRTPGAPREESATSTTAPVYQIYEFSLYQEPGFTGGSRPWGDRLSGGMTWDRVPQPLQQAKAALEGDQIPQTAIRPEPCVFGQVLAGTDPQGDSHYWAFVAVAHQAQDSYNRPLTAFRYFWCEMDQQRPEGLQAILCWFESLGFIPQWDPNDTLHQEPLETYQITVETVSASLPTPLPPPLDAYLLLPDFAQDQSPIPALQHLNQTVIATLQTHNLSWTYLAWAWNIADLTSPQGFFVKPVDEAAYHRLLPRCSILVQPASPNPAQPRTTAPSPPPGTPTPPDLTAAITAVAETYSRDPEHSTNLERLSQALKSLEDGLARLDPNHGIQDLSKAFRSAGCDRTLWEQAQQPSGVAERSLGLLFLQALLLPTESLELEAGSPTNCLTALLALFMAPKASKPNWAAFRKFSRALRKTLWPPTAPDTYKAFPRLHAALIDMGRWFFGAFYLVECEKPNSKTSQSYSKLLKALFQDPLWPFCLTHALDQMLQRLEEPEPPQTWDSTSPGWQQFESDLQVHLIAYQKAWTEHDSHYQSDIRTYPDHTDYYWTQYLQTWPQRAVKLREKRLLWKPLLEQSGLLAAFEHQHDKDPIAASKLQVFVDHLDQGCSTVTTWPPDQLLPGGLVFVPAPKSYYNPRQQSYNNVWQGPVAAAGKAVVDLATQVKRTRPESQPSPPRPAPHRNPTPKPPSPLPGPLPPPRPSWKWFILPIVGVFALGMVGWLALRLRRSGPDPALAKTVIQDINRLAKFQSGGDRTTVTTPGKPTIMSPAELSVALSETLRTEGVITASSEALLDKNQKNLTQALGSYQQRMGLTDPAETAHSLLCLTLDRRIRKPGNSAQPLATTPDRRALTPETLVREIPVCTDRLLFVERQMDLADQRFWFGDILVETQGRAEDSGVMGAQTQLRTFLDRLNQQQKTQVVLPETLTLNPQKPLEQRALLESFYAYALTDTDFSSPLGISEGLINLGSQLPTGGVGTLETTKAFLCTFSETQRLDLPDCDPQAATGDSPQNSPSPSSAPNDPLANLPPDVQSFVQRWADQQGISEAEVLTGLKGALGVPLTGPVTATTWENRIRKFQQGMGEPEQTGSIVKNGTTDANLAQRLFPTE